MVESSDSRELPEANETPVYKPVLNRSLCSGVIFTLVGLLLAAGSLLMFTAGGISSVLNFIPAATLYFLPSLLACFSGSRNAKWVFLINVFIPAPVLWLLPSGYMFPDKFAFFGQANAIIVAASYIFLLLWGLVPYRPRSRSLASRLPRTWTGVAFSAIAMFLAVMSALANFINSANSASSVVCIAGMLINYCLGFYWAFCLYRSHKVLQLMSGGRYTIGPWKALTAGLLGGPQASAITMALLAQIIGWLFPLMKSWNASKFWLAMFAGASASTVVLVLCLTAYLIFWIYESLFDPMVRFANELLQKEKFDTRRVGPMIGACLGISSIYLALSVGASGLFSGAIGTVIMSLVYLVAFWELQKLVLVYGEFARNIPLVPTKSEEKEPQSICDQQNKPAEEATINDTKLSIAQSEQEEGEYPVEDLTIDIAQKDKNRQN